MKKLMWLIAMTAGLASCGGGEDPFAIPAPFAVSLSAAGPDQLQSAAAAPDGKFYAAGFAAVTLAGPRFVTVVKLSPPVLDTTFGNNGVRVSTSIPRTTPARG